MLSLVEAHDIEGLVAAHTVTTLFYLLSKYIGRQRTAAVLLDLPDHVTVTSLDKGILLRAVSLGWEDVEDAVQGISAQRAQADYLVTRNPSDFPSSAVSVVTPKQLLAILASQG